MIESIRIANVATYGTNPEVLDGLSHINYIYGANGSGKTTISRVIANVANYPSCNVRWKGNIPLQAMVYNYDFIERNFTQTRELKGIFTLGESHIETMNQISTLKKEIGDLSAKTVGLRATLEGVDGKGGKKAELERKGLEFKNSVWELKKKYDNNFSTAFEGLRNSTDKFRDRFLQEYASNKADLISLEELKVKAKSIFESNPTQEVNIQVPDSSSLIEIETRKILSKPIIGRTDVDIAAMIQKLGNSDWVKTGRKFYEENDGICPFCQQPTSNTFMESLNEYFDETYILDMDELDSLFQTYEFEYSRLSTILDSIVAMPSRFFEMERFSTAVVLFNSKCLMNKQKLLDKKNEPSRIIMLESLVEILDSIINQIKEANQKINEHNTIVENLASEKKSLTNQVWRFLLEEGKSELSSYLSNKDGLNKAISEITSRIKQNDSEIFLKEQTVRSLEKTTTSIQPTIDGINGLLTQFGFTSFTLSKALSGNSYKLLRPNGSEAKTTLSEGEKSFVCFLYFYYLLKGSESESGTTTDRIVVFDDPVSSLDCDILFVVSSLIRDLFTEVKSGVGPIKQIFILTHNVYFHKEITYRKKKHDNLAKKAETFWIVRKIEQETIVTKYEENTIKTSYELLWAEVRSEQKSPLTIQNTLRRILENYYKILGGYDLDDVCNFFTGKEKLICKSLLSWVNDGSHFAQDEIFVSIDNTQIDMYLAVFRKIFEVSKHFEHYKMMMGESFIEQNSQSLPVVSAQ